MNVLWRHQLRQSKFHFEMFLVVVWFVVAGVRYVSGDVRGDVRGDISGDVTPLSTRRRRLRRRIRRLVAAALFLPAQAQRQTEGDSRLLEERPARRAPALVARPLRPPRRPHARLLFARTHPERVLDGRGVDLNVHLVDVTLTVTEHLQGSRVEHHLRLTNRRWPYTW